MNLILLYSNMRFLCLPIGVFIIWRCESRTHETVPPIITKIVRCDLKIHATKISFTGEKVVWTGI
jgi:hypothetical protein